jgi:hypothetical protein
VQPELGVVVDMGDSVFQRPIPHGARAWMARRARLPAVVRVHGTGSYDGGAAGADPLAELTAKEAAGAERGALEETDGAAGLVV